MIILYVNNVIKVVKIVYLNMIIVYNEKANSLLHTDKQEIYSQRLNLYCKCLENVNDSH